MNRSKESRIYKIFRRDETLGLFMTDKLNTDNINADTHAIGSLKISNKSLKIVTNLIINVKF